MLHLYVVNELVDLLVNTRNRFLNAFFDSPNWSLNSFRHSMKAILLHRTHFQTLTANGQ